MTLDSKVVGDIVEYTTAFLYPDWLYVTTIYLCMENSENGLNLRFERCCIVHFVL